MYKYRLTCLTLACIVAWGVSLCEAQSSSKKKEPEKKYQSQKEVMKDMGPCLKEMEDLDGKLQKEKLYSAQYKLRKGICAQAEHLAELTEAWKPFVNVQKAKLADDQLTASNDLAKTAKATAKKKAMVHEDALAVRMVCAECHPGYKPKQESGEKKGAETK